MFLDFNGLPGCGKTTLSLHIVNEMKKTGKPVLLFQDYIDRHIKSNMGSILYFFSGLLKLPPASFFLFVRFLFTLPRNAPKRLYRWYLLLLNYFLYKNCVRDNPGITVISEQCFIQELLSCYYNQPIKNQKIIVRLIKLLNDDYCVINALLPLDVVLFRLQKRKNGESRLDALYNNPSIMPILSMQNDNITCIRKCMKNIGVNTIEINMEDDLNKNALLIIDNFLNPGGGKT